jgi:hypothetical protein
MCKANNKLELKALSEKPRPVGAFIQCGSKVLAVLCSCRVVCAIYIVQKLPADSCNSLEGRGTS